MRFLINSLIQISNEVGDPGAPEVRRVMIETYVEALLENFTEKGISEFSIADLRKVYVYFVNSIGEHGTSEQARNKIMQFFSALPAFPRALPGNTVAPPNVRQLFH